MLLQPGFLVPSDRRRARRPQWIPAPARSRTADLHVAIATSNRKIMDLGQAGGSSRRSRLRCCGMWSCGAGSGCGGEGDGEPEGLQLADVVAGFLALVDAVGVVAGAQV